MDPLFGRPLFTKTREEMERYRRPYFLLGASYTASFAILEGDGSKLFVADGSSNSSGFFDLRRDSAGLHNVMTTEDFDVYARRVRQELGHIADVYGYHSH
jgi:hypothetical protein